jgi:TonB family protein
MSAMRTLALTLALTLSTTAAAQGLGLGSRNKAGARADAKTLHFELDLLEAINALRVRRKLPRLKMDETLRLTARQQAEYGAKGDPKAKTLAARINAGKLAPHGYRLQYAFGTKAARVMRDLKKETGAIESLSHEFARIGVGAFWVPADDPYFQIAILVALEQDPMAGKTGLTKAQTDPVMKEAAEQIKELCYGKALQRDPNLRGNLIFQVVIGAGGRVDSVKLLSKTESASFNACAVRQVEALRFPAPYRDRPVTLNHPMTFTPPQGEKRIGILTSSQVASAFATARGDFKACYDARIEEKPRLAGSITLSLTVAANGTVARIDVAEDELADPPLRACLLERARRIRFPPPTHGGAAEVRFPLRFNPPAGR